MDTDLETLQAGSHYKFSATKIDKLGAAEYTLASIVMDASTSVAGYAKQLELALKTILKSFDKSPRRANLMMRLTQFADTLTEHHGFKLLGSIKEDDYNGILQIGGMTALFDATDEAVQATSTYGQQLIDMNFQANGIVFVCTDGQNNQGKLREPDPIAKALEKARKAENLESINVVLIGVTQDDNNLDHYLQEFKDKAGITQYVSIGKATPGKIAKLADFISQSISSTSSALGSGAPSQPLNPQQFKF